MRDAARDSYIFTYPLVMMYRTMYLQAIDESSSTFSGGMGQWLHLGTATPADTDIVTPNTDTPYSYAWVDLRAEPWVLTMPAIGADRFYTSQWDDLWGYVLDNCGSVNDGNNGISVLLACPAWDGDLPEGIVRVIQGETSFLGTLTRTQLLPSDKPEDVERIQASYRLEARGPSRPFLMAEIAVGGPARHDQVAVTNGRAVADADLPALLVDLVHVAIKNPYRIPRTQDLPDRFGNVRRRQRGGRNLIQQWLEEMVVVPVDDDGVDAGPAKPARHLEAGKSCADHDHRRPVAGHDLHRIRSALSNLHVRVPGIASLTAAQSACSRAARASGTHAGLSRARPPRSCGG
jgi:Protein of unknown function (DUF1254)